jgi:hypothetical protein
VRANDSDPDGDTLTVTSVTNPPHGTASLNGGNVVYTPDAGWTGVDTFGYSVSDGNGGTDSATVNVTTNMPSGSTIHVADLDPIPRLRSGGTWEARVRIRVHNGSHGNRSGVVVTGTFSTGHTRSCTTNSKGLCTVTVSGLSRTAVLSVVFTVTNLVRSGFTYVSSQNHDPDTDSNGTTIVVNKP